MYIFKSIKRLYSVTPKNKFWNPLYWLQVLISWPLSLEWMNKLFSKEKIVCMFDNMNVDRRLVINARCVPDAGFLWKRNPEFTKLRLGRVFGKESGTFMNEILVHYNGDRIILNMVDATYGGNRLNDSFNIKEVELEKQPVEKRKYPEIGNKLITIDLGTLGKLRFRQIDRGIILQFKAGYRSTITEENTRGALVSKARSVVVKSIDTILPL